MASNHTLFIRIQTSHPSHPSLVLPVEVEVSQDRGLFLSRELLDFGLVKSGGRGGERVEGRRGGRVGRGGGRGGEGGGWGLVASGVVTVVNLAGFRAVSLKGIVCTLWAPSYNIRMLSSVPMVSGVYREVPLVGMFYLCLCCVHRV